MKTDPPPLNRHPFDNLHTIVAAFLRGERTHAYAMQAVWEYKTAIAAAGRADVVQAIDQALILRDRSRSE